MHGATSTILYFEYVNPVLEHISINYISVSSKVLLKREWRFVCFGFQRERCYLKIFCALYTNNSQTVNLFISAMHYLLVTFKSGVQRYEFHYHLCILHFLITCFSVSGVDVVRFFHLLNTVNSSFS